MKELLLSKFKALTRHVRFPQDLEIKDGNDYLDIHAMLTRKFYNAYFFEEEFKPEECEFFNRMLPKGKLLRVAEYFSGAGLKSVKIAQYLSWYYTKFSVPMEDRLNIKFDLIDIDHANSGLPEVEKLTDSITSEFTFNRYTEDVLVEGKDNRYDAIFICMDNPTLTNFPYNKIKRIFKNIRVASKPGALFLAKTPPIVMQPEVDFNNPMHMGEVSVKDEKTGFPVNRNCYLMRGYDIYPGSYYEQIYDLCILTKKSSDNSDQVENAVDAILYMKDGNYLYSPLTIAHMLEDSGFIVNKNNLPNIIGSAI